MSDECQRYNSRLAELLAVKKQESYTSTIAWIRIRVSFAILRSAFVCLRGSRSRRRTKYSKYTGDCVSFSLLGLRETLMRHPEKPEHFSTKQIQAVGHFLNKKLRNFETCGTPLQIERCGALHIVVPQAMKYMSIMFA